MDVISSPVPPRDTSATTSLLDKRLPGRQCVLAWVVATAIFVGLIALLGGPTANDASESLYSTWAVAHGDISCTYSPAPSDAASFIPDYHPGPYVSPLWPLVSGGLSAVGSIGHDQPFPSQQALGTNCVHAEQAMYQWAHKSRAMVPTLGLGYLTWFVLLAGVVALLRASGRGRTGWEVAGVVLVALTPLVWEPVLDEFHPQDLFAMGLVLLGLACALRRSWVWAGALLGLAVLSQQFALLVLVPLFVVAPARGRWRLAAASVASGFLVALPFLATSRRAWHAIAIGTGNSPSFGGTFVRFLHLHGTPLVLVSRVLPIAVAAALAWWVLRRLGALALEPIPLLSLMATCMSLRLVFEQNLFGYYFMALAVMLVLLEVVCGRIRGELVAWIAMAVLAYNPVPWGLAFNAPSWTFQLAAHLREIGMAIALVLIAWDAAHRRVRWYLVAWFVIAILAFGEWSPWTDTVRTQLHPWLWQLILLPTGVALAAWPLVGTLRRPKTGAEQSIEMATL